MPKYSETLDAKVVSMLEEEVTNAEINRQLADSNFEANIDILDCERTEKEYDWMSDIFIPEMPSILLTDASGWASQYFMNRDFVDVRIEGDTKKNMGSAKASGKCINNTLNRRGLKHFAKYMRGRTINALAGEVYAVCEWVKEVNLTKTGEFTEEAEETGLDIFDNPIIGDDQIPAFELLSKEVEVDRISKDYFDYDVIDPRNVFTDNAYVYSIQDKKWISFRSERSLEDLEETIDTIGYFNLSEVKEATKGSMGETKTSGESYNKQQSENKDTDPVIKQFDVYTRYGGFWSVGEGEDISPGLNEDGSIKEEARLVEVIMAHAIIGNKKILIRYQANPFKDALGNSYRPIVRGQCYIHPTRDTGLSDADYGRELQIAINDTFNMSNDRVKLATMPTFKGKKYTLTDNDDIYMEPEHVIAMEDPNDLQEIVISSDVSGALSQIDILKSFTEQVLSVYPTTMGQIPSKASTTATAIAGADARSNVRGSYKSLTFENTFLLDFYWIILQMTDQFAEEETLVELMGEAVYDFDPNTEYHYTPVSSAMEVEHSKQAKLSVIDQMMGRVASIPNPNTPKVLNYLLTKAFEMFGDQFPDFKDVLLDENAPQVLPEGGPNAGQVEATNGVPSSNEQGIPQSGIEQSVRR